MSTVLICGASAAGPALAYWLRRHGHTPTVVERAPGPRPGGQAIDVRGAALRVVERMGVADEVRAARTHMRGMSAVDGDGNETWRSTEIAWSSGRLDSEDVELLREDLTTLLYERTRDDVEYLFDHRLTGLTQRPDGVRVEFEGAPARTFDLVVGADGLHSTVRRLAFGPESEYVHHLGTYLGTFSTPNMLGLEDWQIWLNEGDVGYVVYPVRGNTELRVTGGFHGGPIDIDHHDVPAQRRLIAEKLSTVRWETPKLLAAMWDAPDFYFDAMAQVRMDAWHTGRVALVGDAGYCPSPLSGQGTSLALVGAYVLADELGAAGDDHGRAFAGYQRRMARFVELNQALALTNRGAAPDESGLAEAKNAIELDAAPEGAAR